MVQKWVRPKKTRSIKRVLDTVQELGHRRAPTETEIQSDYDYKKKFNQVFT